MLGLVTRADDTDSTSRFSVGDFVGFHPEGPSTKDGIPPMAHGLVMSVPIAGQQQNYRVELAHGCLLDMPPDSLLDITDLQDEALPKPSDENRDPAQGDPIHPWRPVWMKPGQVVTHHHNGG